MGDDRLRVVSVCSGVGGLDLGLDLAGFRTVALCEFDPWRRRVLAQHWPGVPVFDDLTELDPDDLPEFDVLAGGTPCQDMSSAGKRAGLDGLRSSLFWNFMRIRNARGPRWTVWENVDGARTSNDGEDFAAVLGAFVGADVPLPRKRERDGRRRLESIPGAGVALGPWGGCAWRVLNAQHFGVPQRRRRVFVVGRLGAPCPPEVLIERKGRGGHPPQGARPGALAAGAPHVRAGVARRHDPGCPEAGARAARRVRDHGPAAAGGAARGPVRDGVTGALDTQVGGRGVDSAKVNHLVAPTLVPGMQCSNADGNDERVRLIADAQHARRGHQLPLRAADPADGHAARRRPGAHADEGRDTGALAGGQAAREGDERSQRGRRGGDLGRVRDVADGHSAHEHAAGDGVERAGHPQADADGVREADGLARGLDLAATLTGGGHSDGVSAPGRRREDDVNLVAGTVRTHPRPGSNSETLAFDELHEGCWRRGGVCDCGPRPCGLDAGPRTVFSAQFTPEVADDAASSTLDRASRPPLLHEGIDIYNQNSTGDQSATLWKGGVTMFVALDPETGETLRCEVGESCAFDPSPDSRRYAACGDGVVATVAEWIGRRIVVVDGEGDPDA